MTKVILINGPARSGKDTLADFIHDGQTLTTSLPTEYEFPHRVAKFKFAGVMQKLWRDIFQKIQPVGYLDWVDGAKKNEVHPFLRCSFRASMIDFSENYIKPTYGIDFFGRLTAEEIANEAEWSTDNELIAIVSDSGFKEEAVSVIEKFGAENVLLVKIYRQGFTFDGDSRNYIDLETFGVETVELENITLDQFRRDGIAAVREFVER